MRMMLPLLSTALLAGCGGPARQPDAAPTAPAADGYAAKVAALPAGQRVGVFLRAIRDAGQDCQRVVEATTVGAAGSPPAWLATCDDKRRWVVAIADDGTATVVAAKDLARQR